ncbi:hypothetical protein ACRAWF_21770 [Streptomyces sp. L7]
MLAATDMEAGGVPSGLRRRPADPLRATLRHRPAGAAHRRRRGSPRRVRPAAGRRSNSPEDELESALREAVAAAAPGPRARRHVLLPARPRAARRCTRICCPASAPGCTARSPASSPGAATLPRRAAERAHHYRESHDLAEALAASLRPRTTPSAWARPPRSTASRNRPRSVAVGRSGGPAFRRGHRQRDPHPAGLRCGGARRGHAPRGVPHPVRTRRDRPGHGRRAGRPGPLHAGRQPRWTSTASPPRSPTAARPSR